MEKGSDLSMTAKKPFSDWDQSRKEKHISYDQQHFSVLGCKLPRETADSFRAYCRSQGKTVSGMLSEFVKACLSETSGRHDAL